MLRLKAQEDRENFKGKHANTGDDICSSYWYVSCITNSRQPVHLHKLHSLVTGCMCAYCTWKGQPAMNQDQLFLSVSVTAANYCLCFATTTMTQAHIKVSFHY